MHYFRNSGAGIALLSVGKRVSCVPYTLRVPVRCGLALAKISLFLEVSFSRNLF